MKKQLCILLVAVVLATVVGCESRKTRSSNVSRTYGQKIYLGRPMELRPGKRLPRRPSEDPTDHPCLNGSYYHLYETDNGLKGREVWLCCIDPDLILSGRFDCNPLGPTFDKSILGGDSDYWKIRDCYLQHPTATEVTIIPVCVPADIWIDKQEWLEPRE